MNRLLYLLFALLFVSCIQETQEERNVTISIAQTTVKTAFTSDRAELAWESGDRFGIYHDADGVKNIALEYTGSSQMTFTLPLSANNVYSLFPYDAGAGEDPYSAKVSVPSQQIQKDPGVLTGPMWPMSAAAVIKNNRADLTFSPLTALFAINIYSSEPAKGEAVTHVRVTPTLNSGFCGNARLDLASSQKFTSGDDSKPITLSVTNPRPLNNVKPSDSKLFEDQLYVSIAKQSYTYVKFEVFTTTGKMYSLTSNANPIDAISSDVVTVNINLSKGEITFACISQTDELIEVDGTYSSFEAIVRDPMIDDISEDIIPDFSRVGYHYGDDEIPVYTNIIATLEPTGDETDRAADIQAALNLADGTTNSVVLLKAGDYYVSKPIEVKKSHLVLRGEGGALDSPNRTRLIATGKADMNTCIRLGGEAKSPIVDIRTISEVVEPYVPVGRLSLCVYDASQFNVGERILIYRPGTTQWLHDIRMDQISDNEDWTPEEFHISQERIITGIVGNRIMFDAPIVMALDPYYGGGYVVRISNSGKVVESGVEDIFVESLYDASVTTTYTTTAIKNNYPGGVVCTDENHCHNGVKVVHCEHCWVQRVSGQHFIFSLVGMGNGSRNATVQDCHSYKPISLIQGSRRYAFNANGETSLGLFKGCTAEFDRHQFVTTALSTGPLVYTDCSATRCLGETGPHCFWATGVLYDCIKMDSSQISVQDSDYVGTGASHGWQGANHVLWNCEAPKIVCQSPWIAEGRNPSGRNYCIGCIGTKVLSTTKHYVGNYYLNDRPQAEWVPDPGEGGSNTAHVTSGTYYGVTANGLSLYEAQLSQRKSAGVRAIPSEWY